MLLGPLTGIVTSMMNEAGHQVTLWQDYLSTQFDPAHLLSELGFTIAFEILQLVLWVWLWHKVIKPRWFAQAHAAIDAEHGVEHHEDHLHPSSKLINNTPETVRVTINGTEIQLIEPGETYVIVRQSSISKT